MKRILFSLGMVFLCALLFVGISVVVLMVAPGTEIFGIRYVSLAGDNGSATVEPNLSSDQWLNIKNIEIEAGTAPIIVEKSEVAAGKITFYQSFVGFTRDKIDKPTISYELNEETQTLKLKTAELNRFIVASNECYLKVALPGGLSNVANLTIKSKNSSVTIQGDGALHLNDLKVVGDGSIAFNMKELTLNNLDVSQTTRSLTIPEKVTMTGDVTYSTTVGNLTIATDIPGNINVKTTAGILYFKSCKNLTATTDAGSIRSVSADVQNHVYGNLEFKTTLGDCNIYEIHGTKAYIKTQYGKVDVKHVPNITIEADHGQVYVGHAQNVQVTSSTSTIQIPFVDKSAYITTTFGKIALGGDGCEVNNIDISTKAAKIDVINAVGYVKINASGNALVNVENKNVTNTYIATSGNITAKGLANKVEIYAHGEVNAEFASVDNATIIARDEAVRIKVLKVQTILYKTITDANIPVVKNLETLEEIRKLGKAYEDEGFAAAAHKLYIRAQGAGVEILTKVEGVIV